MSINGDFKNYVVEIEKYAQRHYIKVFRKKHQRAWNVTETAITHELARVDILVEKTDKAEVICTVKEFRLVKLYFKIAGTNTSAKGSGNRAIVFVDNSSFICRVLLVYSKNEIGPPNETQKWKEVIKTNYPVIWKLFLTDKRR